MLSSVNVDVWWQKGNISKVWVTVMDPCFPHLFCQYIIIPFPKIGVAGKL